MEYSGTNQQKSSRISKLGIWSSEFGLEVLAVDKWEVRRDLSGLVLTASSAHDPPYVDIDSVQPHDLPPGYQALLLSPSTFVRMMF